MVHVVLVAIGGAIGSVLRYLTGLAAIRLMGLNFPWGTLAVNIAGSFVIGILAELIARRYGGSPELRVFLVTGILGGFTTFSAFSLDAVALFERGEVMAAGVYIAASVVVSILAVFAGLALIRAMV